MLAPSGSVLDKFGWGLRINSGAQLDYFLEGKQWGYIPPWGSVDHQLWMWLHEDFVQTNMLVLRICANSCDTIDLNLLCEYEKMAVRITSILLFLSTIFDDPRCTRAYRTGRYVRGILKPSPYFKSYCTFEFHLPYIPIQTSLNCCFQGVLPGFTLFSCHWLPLH